MMRPWAIQGRTVEVKRSGLRARRSSAVIIAAILAVHTILLILSAVRQSPVLNETSHLTAGLSHHYLGRFDLFRVNPPLVRMVATLPVAILGPPVDWRHYSTSPLHRSEFDVGSDFFAADTRHALHYVLLARLACIPFALIGGCICFLMSRDLYGLRSGILALLLWCFCPYVLGHAALFTPDAHAASLGIAMMYTFMRWLKRPTPNNTMLLGVMLGLAELSKTTFLIFYPVMVLIWIVWRICSHTKDSCGTAAQLLVAGLISVLVLNMGYYFEGTFRPLGEFQFQSQWLSGTDNHTVGNRFAGSWLSACPVPFPMNYVQGIDSQKWDFERKSSSYLGGSWQFGGWWYYYLYALTIKLPLGTLILLSLAIVATIGQRRNPYFWRCESVVVIPAAAILLLVCSQTGFSIHSRYILPMLPFVYVWTSKVAGIDRPVQKLRTMMMKLAIWSTLCSSLWCVPHNLAYFNEIVGGPLHGHAHLLDSNISWGQDLYYLNDWYCKNNNARPFFMAYYGPIDPRLLGVRFKIPAIGPFTNAKALSPGWYAIDVNCLRGSSRAVSDGNGRWQSMANGDYDLTYFQRFQPTTRVGYSLCIYHLTPQDVDSVLMSQAGNSNKERSESGGTSRSGVGNENDTSPSHFDKGK